MSWRSLSQSAMVGREVGGGAGRTQSGTPIADVKVARSSRWRACRRMAHEVMDREGITPQVLENQAMIQRITADA